MIRIGIKGDYDVQPEGIKFNAEPDGGEMTLVQHLRMHVELESTYQDARIGPLMIQVTRDFSHGTAEDLLASRFLFGTEGAGEARPFSGQMLFIDDARTGRDAIVGLWILHEAQIIEVSQSDGDGNAPCEEHVLISASRWDYLTPKETPQQLVAEPTLLPVCATRV